MPSLNDGSTVPAIGLGTYDIRGFSGADAMASAIKSGYRYLDTAYNYENEGAVGEAIRRSGVDRREILVASKLPGRYHSREAALTAIEEGLMRAGLDYFDFYLIHWPLPMQDKYVEAWQALIEARDRGLVKHLGVSNFLPEHIERIEAETGVTPTLNQIELHPYFQQTEQVAYHAERGILTQAWSPLGGRDRAKFDPQIFEHPTLIEIAAELGASVEQVMIAWHLRRGVMPLPKSANPDRLAANLEAQSLTITDAQMSRIAELDRSDGRVRGQDPATHEEY